MQNKKQQILRYLLRRYAFIIFISFAVAFFFITFSGMIEIAENADWLRSLEETSVSDLAESRLVTKRFLSNLVNLGLSQEILSVGFAGLGVLTSLMLFQHLFSRRKAMFVAEQPIRRQDDFLLRTGVYVLAGLLPTACALLLYPISALVLGMGDCIGINAYRQIGVLLVMHFYGFAIGTLTTMLTGYMWASIAGIVILIAGCEITIFCWQKIAVHYLYTWPTEAGMNFIRKWSPAFTLYKSLLKPDTYSVVLGLLTAIVAMLLALFAYRHRAVEKAEHTIAFETLEIPLGILTTLIGGTVIGFLFMNMLNSGTALVLTLILGAFVVWMASRLVFTFHPKEMWTGLPWASLCSLILASLVFFMRIDLLGIDRYAPNADKVTSITISAYNGANDERYTVENPETIQAALSFMEMLRESSVGNQGYHSVSYSDVTISVNEGRSVTRCFKSGLPTFELRKTEAWKENVAALVGSGEYRQGFLDNKKLYEFLHTLEAGSSDDLNMYITPSSYGSSELLSTDTFQRMIGKRSSMYNFTKDEMIAILNAFIEDFGNRTPETMQTDPIYSIQIYGKINEEYTSSHEMNVYPSDLHVLTQLFDLKTQEAVDWITGEFAADTEHYAVYKVKFDTPVAERKSSSYSYSPISWEKAADGEEAIKWVRQSISKDYGTKYYSASVDDYEEVWLFDLDSIQMEMTDRDFQSMDLVEGSMENPYIYDVRMRWCIL